MLQLFGRYEGTVKRPGLAWANPFFGKRAVSQRVINFQSEHNKVNDVEGNPIEIAAIIVWRVVDTAKAIFDVSDCGDFVRVQTEFKRCDPSPPPILTTPTSKGSSRCAATSTWSPIT